MRNNKGIKDLPIWKTDCEVRLEDRYHPHRNLGRGSLLWGAGSPCPPQMNPEGEMTMKPDYRNWMPRGMIVGLGTAAGVLAAGSAAAVRSRLPMGRTAKHLVGAALGLGAVGCLAGAAWSLYAREMFSYEGGRQGCGVRQRGADHRLCQTEPPGPHGGHRPLGRGIRLLQPETL